MSRNSPICQSKRNSTQQSGGGSNTEVSKRVSAAVTIPNNAASCRKSHPLSKCDQQCSSGSKTAAPVSGRDCPGMYTRPMSAYPGHCVNFTASSGLNPRDSRKPAVIAKPPVYYKQEKDVVSASKLGSNFVSSSISVDGSDAAASAVSFMNGTRNAKRRLAQARRKMTAAPQSQQVQSLPPGLDKKKCPGGTGSKTGTGRWNHTSGTTSVSAPSTSTASAVISEVDMDIDDTVIQVVLSLLAF